jgi:hypothetical protein
MRSVVVLHGGMRFVSLCRMLFSHAVNSYGLVIFNFHVLGKVQTSVTIRCVEEVLRWVA